MTGKVKGLKIEELVAWCETRWCFGVCMDLELRAVE